MKTKVIFLTSVFSSINTGPGIYADYLWNSFRDDREIDFHIVAPSANERDSNLHLTGNYERSLAQYAALQNRALELAKKLGPQTIIHSNNAHAVYRLKYFKGKLIVQINDYDSAEAWSNPLQKIKNYGLRRMASLAWRRNRERKALKKSDVVVFNSNYTMTRIRDAYKDIHLSCPQIIYKAVDLDSFKIDAVKSTSDTRGQRVIFVGSNWQIKGLDIALRAVANLALELPELSLTVAGKTSGSGNQKIRTLASTLGIENRVNFLGTVKRSKLKDVLSNSDLLILPSRKEALGVSILEGLAAGLPVVGTRVGGIPEIINGSRHSKLVPPDDVESLGRAIKQTLLDGDKPSAVQTESRAIAARFSKKIMIEKIRNLYLGLEARS